LLILDDWGPDRFTASQPRDLMEIVEDRYGAGSTLITSQLPVEAWHEVIGEPTFADAILDRIVHNAYRFALEGPSMRKPEATNADAPANGADSGIAISTKPTKATGNRVNLLLSPLHAREAQTEPHLPPLRRRALSPIPS